MQLPFTSGLTLVALILLGLTPTARADEFVVIDHQRQTVYHSPQTPGYACWVGAWTMPDSSMMVSFTQATGPVEGRPQAPKEVQEKLCWPPSGRPGRNRTYPDRPTIHAPFRLRMA